MRRGSQGGGPLGRLPSKSQIASSVMMPRRARLTIAFLAAHPGFSSARDGEAEAHVHVHLPRRHSSAVCCAGAPAHGGHQGQRLASVSGVDEVDVHERDSRMGEKQCGWMAAARPQAPQNRKGPPPSDLACLPMLAGGRLGSHRRAHMTSRRLISSILSTPPSPRPAGCPPSVRSELHELDVPARL